MSSLLLRNIGRLQGVTDAPCLRGEPMHSSQYIDNAWLHIVDGRIADFGTGQPPLPADSDFDCHGAMVIPAWCDSHSHIVWAGSRWREFVDKVHGLSYEEIARRGGGILNSADRLAATSEDDLFSQSMERVRQVMSMGTGALEIKSGYGLSVESELKMLRVIARIADTVPIQVRATFLGAHAVGREYAGRQDEYVNMVIEKMLPAVAAEGLARYVDVFCDAGFFTPDETARILEAAARYGMRPKIHGCELDASGGVEVAVANRALSVDHLERASDADIRMLAGSDTVATMLPGASFFLGMPYGPARRAVDSGAILALASDFNPGSSPSGDMRFVYAMGCIKMRLDPAEAFNATTLNGAYAMGLGDDLGSIARGKRANLIVGNRPATDADPLASLAYMYTEPYISRIFFDGHIYSN
ncbi:MAG: imidazolonepropionase [Paramuribaculum sp.]|nr:imidazolonepropionase [Paramuribaculum sp.]